MKVAFSVAEGKINEHFGKCCEFSIFEIENGEVTKQTSLKVPTELKGKERICLLKENGVDTFVGYCCGDGAKKNFAQHGIKPIFGVQGDVEEALKLLLEDKLVGKEVVCEHTGEHSNNHNFNHNNCHHNHHHNNHHNKSCGCGRKHRNK